MDYSSAITSCLSLLYVLTTLRVRFNCIRKEPNTVLSRLFHICKMSESGVSMFTDLSGPTTATFDNPYNAMLEGCNQDPRQIQQRYKTHREARNEQQKAKLLSPTFTGFLIDPILDKLRHDSSYVDPRNCLVFWAPPPLRIRSLVNEIQQRLLRVAPSKPPFSSEDRSTNYR